MHIPLDRPAVFGVEPMSKHRCERGVNCAEVWKNGGWIYWNLGKKDGIYILI